MSAYSCKEPGWVDGYICISDKDDQKECVASGGVSHSGYSWVGTNDGVEEICTRTPYPLPRVAPGARGHIEFNRVTGKCSCFYNNRPAPELYPDKTTGLCYDPPRLEISVSRRTYKPSEAGKPVDISIQALRGDGVPVSNVELRLSVATLDGEAGTLSARTGVTDANGYVKVQYTFPPNFSQKKVDDIVINCQECGNEITQFDMKMSPTVVGFFNGVWNTQKQANDSLTALKVQTNAVRGKVATKYDLFYNQTGCGTAGATCLQDVAEVFALRSLELDGVMANRWETFWDVLSGRHTEPRTMTGGLFDYLGGVGSGFGQFLDSVFNATLGQIFAGYSYLLSNPPTASDVATHLAKLQGFASDDYSFMLVAHSQGNLFVNRAFDGLKGSHPTAQAKVVHIAPASPTLRGEYILADIDKVILGLRSQGVTSVPAANITLPNSRVDLSGHTIAGTYLDASRAALERIKTMLKTALTSL